MHEYAQARIVEPWRSLWNKSGATKSANQATNAVFCNVKALGFGQGSEYLLATVSCPRCYTNCWTLT